VVFNPGLLEDGPKVKTIDWTTGELFDPKEIRELCYEHAQLIQFLHDFDRGVITVSLTEYNTLPGLLLEALTLYREAKAQSESAQWEKLKQ